MPLGFPLIAQQVPGRDVPLVPEPLAPPRRFADRGTIILLASLLTLALVIVFWAFFVRKRPKGPRGTLTVDGSRHRSSQAYGLSGRRRRRKRRENHPENLGRNPTLSETGGLPPLRPEEPPSPPSAESSQPL